MKIKLKDLINLEDHEELGYKQCNMVYCSIPTCSAYIYSYLNYLGIDMHKKGHFLIKHYRLL